MYSQQSFAVNAKSVGAAQLSMYGKEKPLQGSQGPRPLRALPQNSASQKLLPTQTSGNNNQPSPQTTHGTEPKGERGEIKVTLTGRVGRNARLRETNGGHTVVDFFVGTDGSYKNRFGEWQQKTTWYRVKKWGASAAMLSPHLQEGARVYVEGRLAIRKWTDKNNVPQTSTEIMASDVRFLNQRAKTPAA